MSKFSILQQYIQLLDYSSPELPQPVRKLKPTPYEDDEAFCCISGDDPVQGVFGCGKTASEALED